MAIPGLILPNLRQLSGTFFALNHLPPALFRAQKASYKLKLRRQVKLESSGKAQEVKQSDASNSARGW